MKLYHSPFSSNALKARVTAHHLGIEPELVTIDLAKGEQRRPEFMAVNPNGKVPVLVDDDFVLSESQAIMAYLADKTPGQTLYPTELRARAEVNKWMFWSANHWGPSISQINWERLVKKFLGMGEPDEAVVAKAVTMFHDFAKVLDSHLEKREWLVGNGVTLADIAVGCPLMVAVPAQLPLASYANLQAWFARVQELPAWKAVAPRG
ncbi:Glutathione S-transferase [Labilithrix luteola]|uniref:Glutathione S-transferase n=1 Tax=Labilithrix luteola TaxID=1391654 RepID=A0A0K1PW96_9BACT|nr:glutathione S-transferase family protein [Labilithrix luteola]AKU97666.1 Glutathione S-transferase [Labilithrix luteola]